MNTTNMRIPSNRVRDIERYMHEELDIQYGNGEVGTFFEMLCEAFLGWDRVRLMTSKKQTVNQSDLLRFHWAVEDLKRYRPVQHIIGYTDFCGCRIKVDPDVLIPRPETEEVVDWCIHQLLEPTAKTPSLNQPGHPASILDLCTGSGCIAIALKKALPEAEVTAVDLSSAALAIARQNATENGTEVNFLHADILAPLPFHLSPLTLIISNPPYVMESERETMSRNVLEYEPETALFVPDRDALCFYRAIATIAAQWLAPDGLLVVEINEQLADNTCRLLREKGLEPEVRQDFRGKDRCIVARRNVKYFAC